MNKEVTVADLERSIAIAVAAHEGQKDKGGSPYILHPLRVMMSLRTEEEMIVGVLHDVIEDCASKGYDWEMLSREGFSDRVIEALKSVTKTPEEDAELKSLSGDERVRAYLRFIDRAKRNQIGRRVKRADIHDNCNVLRIGTLTDKDLSRLNQYKRALDYLNLQNDTEAC